MLVILTLAPTALSAQITAKGIVRDGSTEAPIADARVIIFETRSAVFSGPDGTFAVEVPEPGFYTFRIVVGGEIQQLRRQIRFENQEFTLYFGERAPQQEDEADVEEGAISIVGLKDQTKLSRFRFSRDEIKRLPGVYGDSLKAVETLPGISAAPPVGVLPSSNPLSNSTISSFGVGPPYSNSQTGVLVIRGSGARASAFFLDGLKIQYPFHLGDQSSVIHNDYIRNVDVYTGTYPVRYGNSTGGIISIEGPTKVERTTTHINVSMFKSDAFIETPLPFLPGEMYFVGSARQSYPNYPLLILYPEAIPANAKYANYQDGQFKLGGKFGNNHEFALLYFGARDILDYARSVDELSSDESGGLGGAGGALGGAAGGGGLTDPDTEGSRPPVGLDRSFHTQGLSYAYSYGGYFRTTIYAQVSRFKEDFELDFRSPFTGETIFGYEVLDARREFQVRDEIQYELIRKHAVLNLGFEYNDYRWELSLDNFSPQQSVNPNTPDFVEVVNDLVENDPTFRALLDGDRTNFNLNAYFAELELAFWRFRLTPGVRHEYYSLSNSTGLGPRAGVEFNIPETDTVLLAGAGRHFNVPTSLSFVSVEAGNPYLKMEESDHLAAGIEQKFGKEWLFKLEVFRNYFRNLVVEDQFIVIPLSPRTNRRDQVTNAQNIIEEPFENRFLNYSNDGEGFSEGFEVYLKKSRPPGSSGWFGWISYTNSIAKRNNHQPRLSTEERQDLASRNATRSILSYVEVDDIIWYYYDTGESEFFYDNDREELYDLDRTHQISFVLNYKFNAEWQIGSRWRYSTNVPFTPIVGNQDVFNLPVVDRPTFLARYSDRYNSDRLHPVHQLDIRLDRFLNYGWGYANWYVELINVYARRNPESENFSFLLPYNRGSNPSIVYESTFIETPAGGGRKWLFPLINLGLELKF